MEDSLILSENFPESINLFMGDGIYMVQEKVDYDTINVLGENQLRFLHIINNSTEKFLNQTDYEMFFKYINAIQSDKIKMDKDGFAILNLNQYPGITWENIKVKLNPKVCFFWGVNPLILGLEVPQFTLTKTQDTQTVFLDDVNVTLNNKDSKLKLWGITKTIFEI